MDVPVEDGDPLGAERLWAWRAAMAALLKKQKPMARLRSAWCPGGRMATKALGARPDMTSSTARTAPPAPLEAAS
jgi:hypothetical protein